MSQSINRGVATVAVNGCGAMVKATAKAVHGAVESIVNEMSDGAQRDYEYLLSVMQADKTEAAQNVTEVREQVSNRIAQLKKHLLESKYQMTDQSLIPIVALSQSTLGEIVKPNEWQSLAGNKGEAAFGKLLDNTSQTWGKNNFKYIVTSVLEVAKNEGFLTPLKQKIEDNRAVLSLVDTHGRAVIAKLSDNKSGVALDIDLGGFKGDGCNEVMDKIIDGLASKNITLRHSVRKKHLTLGSLKNSLKKNNKKGAKKRIVSTTDEKIKKSDFQRRLQVNESMKKNERN